MSAESPSLLIVRFGAIGDCVMTAWAATAFRNRFPKSRITWVIEDRCAMLVDREQAVNDVDEIPKTRWKAMRWSPRTWGEQLGKYARLRRQRFEYGVDFQGHSKTALCLRIASPKNRVAARATDSLARRLNPTPALPPGDMHSVDWNHLTLCRFGEFELPGRPIMPASSPNGLPAFGSKPLATISVGAGQAAKKVPAESWAQVSQALSDLGFDVWLLGGQDELPIQAQGLDLVGKLSLAQTMSAVAFSSVHLAADTGTGHMAAAYGVPCVSVFGPTNPQVYRPYSDRGVVIRRGASTSEVSSEEIVQAAEHLLEERVCVI